MEYINEHIEVVISIYVVDELLTHELKDRKEESFAQSHTKSGMSQNQDSAHIFWIQSQYTTLYHGLVKAQNNDNKKNRICVQIYSKKIFNLKKKHSKNFYVNKDSAMGISMRKRRFN